MGERAERAVVKRGDEDAIDASLSEAFDMFVEAHGEESLDPWWIGLIRGKISSLITKIGDRRPT